MDALTSDFWIIITTCYFTTYYEYKELILCIIVAIKHGGSTKKLQPGIEEAMNKFTNS